MNSTTQNSNILWYFVTFPLAAITLALLLNPAQPNPAQPKVIKDDKVSNISLTITFNDDREKRLIIPLTWEQLNAVTSNKIPHLVTKVEIK
jgi:hypothetical protein